MVLLTLFFPLGTQANEQVAEDLFKPMRVGMDERLPSWIKDELPEQLFEVNRFIEETFGSVRTHDLTVRVFLTRPDDPWQTTVSRRYSQNGSPAFVDIRIHGAAKSRDSSKLKGLVRQVFPAIAASYGVLPVPEKRLSPYRWLDAGAIEYFSNRLTRDPSSFMETVQDWESNCDLQFAMNDNTYVWGKDDFDIPCGAFIYAVLDRAFRHESGGKRGVEQVWAVYRGLGDAADTSQEPVGLFIQALESVQQTVPASAFLSEFMATDKRLYELIGRYGPQFGLWKGWPYEEQNK